MAPDVTTTQVDVSSAWNIGDNPNGGYLLSLVLDAIAEVSPHPDPLSITTHFLRPGLGDQPGEVRVAIVRSGRAVTTVQASLHQAGAERLLVMAAFGNLESAATEPTITVPPPDLPPAEECIPRAQQKQGVQLPLVEQIDCRVHPAQAEGGAAGEAVISGWIRLPGEEPTTRTLPLFADTFAPSVFGLLGRVGWVPTVELTVHVRARPVPGWIAGAFRCDDLVDGGWMIESGSLWDSAGTLVARVRQLGIVRYE